MRIKTLTMIMWMLWCAPAGNIKAIGNQHIDVVAAVCDQNQNPVSSWWCCRCRHSFLLFAMKIKIKTLFHFDVDRRCRCPCLLLAIKIKIKTLFQVDDDVVAATPFCYLHSKSKLKPCFKLMMMLWRLRGNKRHNIPIKWNHRHDVVAAATALDFQLRRRINNLMS